MSRRTQSDTKIYIRHQIWYRAFIKNILKMNNTYGILPLNTLLYLDSDRHLILYVKIHNINFFNAVLSILKKKHKIKI